MSTTSISGTVSSLSRSSSSMIFVIASTSRGRPLQDDDVQVGQDFDFEVSAHIGKGRPFDSFVPRTAPHRPPNLDIGPPPGTRAGWAAGAAPGWSIWLTNS